MGSNSRILNKIELTLNFSAYYDSPSNCSKQYQSQAAAR